MPKENQPKGITEKQVSDELRQVLGRDKLRIHDLTRRPTNADRRALRDAAKRGALVHLQ